MGSEMRLSVSSLLFNGSSVKVWLIYILDIFQTDNTFPYIMPKVRFTASTVLYNDAGKLGGPQIHRLLTHDHFLDLPFGIVTVA